MKRQKPTKEQLQRRNYKLQMNDGINTLKYSHIAGLLAAAGPVALALLAFIGFFGSFASSLITGIAMAAGFVVGIFILAMKLAQVMFLFKGYNVLAKIRSSPCFAKAQSGKNLVIIYLAALIGGWAIQSNIEHPSAKIIYNFITTVLILLAYRKTADILMHFTKPQENGVLITIKNTALGLIILAATIAIIGLASEVFWSSGNSVFLTIISYDPVSFLKLIISILILKAINRFGGRLSQLPDAVEKAI